MCKQTIAAAMVLEDGRPQPAPNNFIVTLTVLVVQRRQLAKCTGVDRIQAVLVATEWATGMARRGSSNAKLPQVKQEANIAAEARLHKARRGHAEHLFIAWSAIRGAPVCTAHGQWKPGPEATSETCTGGAIIAAMTSTGSRLTKPRASPEDLRLPRCPL